MSKTDVVALRLQQGTDDATEVCASPCLRSVCASTAVLTCCPLCDQFLKAYGGLLHDQLPAIVFLSKGVAVEAVTGFVSAHQFADTYEKATRKHSRQLTAHASNPWSIVVGSQPGEAPNPTQSSEEPVAQGSAVEVAKTVDTLEQDQKLAKLKQQQEERKRQKKAEEEYKRKLLANIESDRKRRAQQTQEDTQGITPKGSKSVAKELSVESSQGGAGDFKLVFRMKDPTGKMHTVKHSFPRDTPLINTCARVHTSLVQSLDPVPMPATFHYVTNVPPKRRVFSEPEYQATLESLDLCTNCIIEVEVGPTPNVDTEGNLIQPQTKESVDPLATHTCMSGVPGVRQCDESCAVM